MDVADPHFTRLRFFELPEKASELEAALREEYPGRDVRVYGGDCNDTFPTALGELAEIRLAATFAFLDPDGMELEWSTLEALARHKAGYRVTGRSEYKVELWMLFPTPGLIRALALDQAKLRPDDVRRATRLFGDERWRAIYDRRVSNHMEASEARDEYVNLLRWRLERDLGYRRTHPLEIKNERGLPLYHMVFATDNEAGDRIMTDLYGKTASRSEAMRQEALERRRGARQLGLFPNADVAISSLYRYEPPHEPPP
jgi:three-Cys-motif partner protein